ncbi:MAG: ABC transporter substrate-binding protein [Chlorobiaceae bacterium]|nr:ABC transporter substrate-binding protein [Chlorobiaceae bacterium]
MKKIIMTLLLLLFAGAARADGRIVSQSPYITETLVWLGLGDRIVGVSRYDEFDRPKTGGVKDPDAAAIARLKPDYLFVSGWTNPEVRQRVTPPGAKCVVLHGFKSMAEIGGNIRAICGALGIPGGDGKAAEFDRQWRSAAAQLNGGGRRALILSSCQGDAYSFGVNTYLHDLLSRAGFNVVEEWPEIRHINPSELTGSVWELIEEYRPEIVFVLRKDGYGCPVSIPDGKYRVVELDGEHFASPSPRLLDGLEKLQKELNTP